MSLSSHKIQFHHDDCHQDFVCDNTLYDTGWFTSVLCTKSYKNNNDATLWGYVCQYKLVENLH
jgi:hypothetical protein